MKLIPQIQERLQKLYALNVQAQALDYLIHKNELHELIPEAHSQNVPRELFLVNPSPDDDTLEIALYFDSSLQENLVRHDPSVSLNGENISDFCALIEGVSHFVYYLHKASREQDVTQLELEIQAEVDKFSFLNLCTESQCSNPDVFWEVLFENYSLHRGISNEQTERYLTANRLAGRFCRSLLANINPASLSTVIQEARLFYDLPQSEKIRRIAE